MKVANKDEGGNNIVKFDPKFWQLPEKPLHMLLCVFVETEDTKKELESMKLSEMQGLLLAYATKDRDVPAALLKKTGKGLRESVSVCDVLLYPAVHCLGVCFAVECVYLSGEWFASHYLWDVL